MAIFIYNCSNCKVEVGEEISYEEKNTFVAKCFVCDEFMIEKKEKPIIAMSMPSIPEKK